MNLTTWLDRLLASSAHPIVRLSVCLWCCALWLSGLVYWAKSCTSVFLAGMFLCPFRHFGCRTYRLATKCTTKNRRVKETRVCISLYRLLTVEPRDLILSSRCAIEWVKLSTVTTWSPYLRKDISCLERVQQKATKLVKGLKWLIYEQRLQRNASHHIGEAQIERRSDWDIQAILTGNENVDSGCFFQLDGSHYSTRGHQYNLQKHWSRWCPEEFFSAAEWPRSGTSCLAAHVVEADTVMTFKNRLDACSRWGN